MASLNRSSVVVVTLLCFSACSRSGDEPLQFGPEHLDIPARHIALSNCLLGTIGCSKAAIILYPDLPESEQPLITLEDSADVCSGKPDKLVDGWVEVQAVCNQTDPQPPVTIDETDPVLVKQADQGGATWTYLLSEHNDLPLAACHKREGGMEGSCLTMGRIGSIVYTMRLSDAGVVDIGKYQVDLEKLIQDWKRA